MNWEGIILVITMSALSLALGLWWAGHQKARINKWTNYLIALGAGMLLGLCLGEFLPHSFEHASRATPFIMLAGMFLVIASEKYISPLFVKEHLAHCDHDHGHGHAHRSISAHVACSSIGCVLICAFFDGWEIMAGFEMGRQTGLLITTGMFLHALPEGVLVASLGLAGGLSIKTVRLNVAAVSVAILMGGALGALAVEIFDFQLIVLPLATGVLLYLAIGHLLPMALQERWGIMGVLLGAIFVLIFSLSGHAHASESHRRHSHGAHVHGEGKLQVAVDTNQLTLLLKLPQQDVVGFEHEPKDLKEKKKLIDALATLRDTQSLFSPSKAAECSAETAKALDRAAGNDRHHADLEFEYKYTCKKPKLLESLKVLLFARYPKIKSLKAQAISESGQASQELTPKKSEFDLKSL